MQNDEGGREGYREREKGPARGKGSMRYEAKE